MLNGGVPDSPPNTSGRLRQSQGAVGIWRRGSWSGQPPGIKPIQATTESEPEYGQRFRVLRGSPAGSNVSPHERRFMAPGQRNRQVGFRCVEETP